MTRDAPRSPSPREPLSNWWGGHGGHRYSIRLEMRKQEENGSQVMAAWYESTFELRHVFGATLGGNATLNQFFEKRIHVRGGLPEIGGRLEWPPLQGGLWHCVEKR